MLNIKDGIYPNMTNEEYHNSLGYSKTTLDGILKQADYIEWKSNATKYDDRALVVGSALHTSVLEPNEYSARYTVRPKFDMRKKDDKEQAVLWDENHSTHVILSSDEHDGISAMTESIKASPYAQSLLKGGASEVSIFHTLENGLQVKIRPDYIVEDKGIIVDVKTTKDVNDFGRSAINYGYDMQAAMYTMIAEKVYNKPFKFFFVVVGKDKNCGTYPVRVYETPKLVIERGTRLFNQAIAKVQALNKAETPIYDILQVPSWALASSEF